MLLSKRPRAAVTLGPKDSARAKAAPAKPASGQTLYDKPVPGNGRNPQPGRAPVSGLRQCDTGHSGAPIGGGNINHSPVDGRGVVVPVEEKQQGFAKLYPVMGQHYCRNRV